MTGLRHPLRVSAFLVKVSVNLEKCCYECIIRFARAIHQPIEILEKLVRSSCLLHASYVSSAVATSHFLGIEKNVAPFYLPSQNSELSSVKTFVLPLHQGEAIQNTPLELFQTCV